MSIETGAVKQKPVEHICLRLQNLLAVFVNYNWTQQSQHYSITRPLENPALYGMAWK